MKHQGETPKAHFGQLDKCVGTGCDRRTGCVRFRSLVSGQDVLNPPPLKRVTQACAYFHPIGVMPNALMLDIAEAEAWAAQTIAKPPSNRTKRGL